MALERLAQRPGAQVPDPDGAVVGPGCECLSVRAEAGSLDAAGRLARELSFGVCSEVDEGDAAVVVTESGLVRRRRQGGGATQGKRPDTPERAPVKEHRPPVAGDEEEAAARIPDEPPIRDLRRPCERAPRSRVSLARRYSAAG